MWVRGELQHVADALGVTLAGNFARGEKEDPYDIR